MAYDYSCIMLEVICPEWQNILDVIDSEDLDKNGLENEPHITILYGILPEVKSNQIINIIKDWLKPEFSVWQFGLFENGENDVLKLTVTSMDLGSMNEKAKELPFESKFQLYMPHITVAYLKKGTGRKYLDKVVPKSKFASGDFIISLSDGRSSIQVKPKEHILNYDDFRKRKTRLEFSPFISGYAQIPIISGETKDKK